MQLVGLNKTVERKLISLFISFYFYLGYDDRELCILSSFNRELTLSVIVYVGLLTLLPSDEPISSLGYLCLMGTWFERVSCDVGPP